ncbi:MAG: hypothetical protein DLM73_06405 [Chthoniobacterales bacterium]|nr:MAG: hypothetical protein DLM73_06405 [Chthoniobacterales bacterium]
MSAKFFGKYRAVVVNTNDPQAIGRIQVTVPEITDREIGLAMRCVPPNNTSTKLGSALPRVGAKVWVEFERGDLNFPIWSGCFFGPGETPPSLRHA